MFGGGVGAEERPALALIQRGVLLFPPTPPPRPPRRVIVTEAPGAHIAIDVFGSNLSTIQYRGSP